VIKLPPQFAPSKPFSLDEISRYDSRGPGGTGTISLRRAYRTHFDAPIHWVTGKDFPRNATHNHPGGPFIGPACVIDVARQPGQRRLPIDDRVIEGWERQHGMIPDTPGCLIRHPMSKRAGADAYLNIAPDGPHTPGFHP